ncbi:MAG: hypothetical protein VYE05_02645 [Bacteroidota bacterium]|nr:hypothetical protein [Bacteroidota bacterium]
MKNTLLILIYITLFSCESKNEVNDLNESIELPALRFNNSFSQPYRILRTTISEANHFDKKYGNTDLTLGYVLRYYFYTAIDLDNDKSELISMDKSSFKLNSTENPEEIVIETINEIRKMTFGSSEFKSFIEKYFSQCVDISKIVNDCIAIQIYDPVCGCNGFTYPNSAYALCHGVSDYKKGPCN